MTYQMPRDDVLYSNAFFAEENLSLSWPVQAALSADLVCTSVFCSRPHSLVGPLACPCTPISGAWYPFNASMQEGAVAGLAGALSSRSSRLPLSRFSVPSWQRGGCSASRRGFTLAWPGFGLGLLRCGFALLGPARLRAVLQTVDSCPC